MPVKKKDYLDELANLFNLFSLSLLRITYLIEIKKILLKIL